MNILDYTPFGKEKAVSRDFLANLYGGGTLGDRKARAAIEKAREKTVIVNVQDGGGYFRPLPEEWDLVERQFRQTESRVRKISRQKKAIKRWQKDHSGQQSLEG